MNYLPDGVLDDILVRLPAKELVVCTCVCKSWKTWIMNPRFIDAHRQRQRPDHLMLRTFREGGFELGSFSVSDTFTEHRKDVFSMIDGSYNIVGSCNGVFCMTINRTGYMDETYLWNPIIRRVVPCLRTSELRCFSTRTTRFGFDEKTNDYKVVTVADFYHGEKRSLKIEIFSLSTGIWKDVSQLGAYIQNCTEILSVKYIRQAYLKGAAHWIVRRREGSESKRVVLVFHFDDEVFRFIELADEIINGNFFDPATIRGSLCLFQHYGGGCLLWMMTEYGVPSSWTKQLDISFSTNIERVIGLRNEAELLLAGEKNLYSFDFNIEPNRTAAKRLRLLSTKTFTYIVQSEIYMESLVLLGAERAVVDGEFQRIHEEMDSKREKGVRNGKKRAKVDESQRRKSIMQKKKKQ